MGKKEQQRPSAEDNPFAALSGLGDLPPGPEQPASEPDPAAEDDTMDRTAAVRIYLDRKQRRGKTATVVDGLDGSPDTLQELGKQLKVACGVGGSVKDGQIILQGDHRDRVLSWLKERGFRDVKKAGG